MHPQIEGQTDMTNQCLHFKGYKNKTKLEE